MADYQNVKLKLIKEVPMFYKDSVFYFDFDEAMVYGVEDDKVNETPLRQGLAGYLWLLRYEPGYFRKIKDK